MSLKPGKVSSLIISYNITISQLYPLNGFLFIFYCMTVKTICLRETEGLNSGPPYKNPSSLQQEEEFEIQISNH